MILIAYILFYCKNIPIDDILEDIKAQDSIIEAKKVEEIEKNRPRTKDDIVLKKELTFDKYTLEDTYPYKDTTRVFQWDKIKEKLAYVENFQREKITYAVLQNYKNKN